MNRCCEDLLDQLLSVRAEGLVAFDCDGYVTSVSPSFLALTSAQTEAAVLSGLSEAQFSDWLAQRSALGAPFSGIERLRQRALHDESRRTETIALNEGGVLLALTWCSNAAAGLLLARDVSVDSVADQAAQRSLAKTAHDLRSPLASICGFAEMLQTQTLDASTQQEFLKIMVDQAERLTQMMTEVFDLARMQARQGKDYAFARTALQPLVAEVVERLPLASGQVRPVLVLPQAPIWVMADVKKLQQALRQAIAGAHQLSPVGAHLRLEVSSLNRVGVPDVVCIQLTTPATGATPELVRLADRSPHTNPHVSPTVGHGMALVKEIVARHHGDLYVSSSPMHVAIDLPLAPPVS